MSAASTFLLAALAPELLDELKDELRAQTRRDPADALIWTTLIASKLFYDAEVGHNPKVKTFEDALVFVTTNCSVGYCDIFACTPRGKQIASLLMTFGPAMAAKALDDTALERARAARAADEAGKVAHAELLGRLDRIALLLSAGRAMP